MQIKFIVKEITDNKTKMLLAFRYCSDGTADNWFAIRTAKYLFSEATVFQYSMFMKQIFKKIFQSIDTVTFVMKKMTALQIENKDIIKYNAKF